MLRDASGEKVPTPPAEPIDPAHHPRQVFTIRRLQAPDP